MVTDYAEGELFQILEDDGSLPEEQVTNSNTVRPVLSDHIKQDIFLAFQSGGCLLLHESSAESSSCSQKYVLFYMVA